MTENQTLDISWASILKIAIAASLFYLLYLVRDILILFTFALIISLLFNPAIDFLQRRKIPRVVSVIIIYIGTFGLITLLIYSISASFVSEIQNFSQIFPAYFEKLSPFLRSLGINIFENIESFIGFINKFLEAATVNLFATGSAIFGGVFSTLFVISIAIFLSLEAKNLEKGLVILFPKKYDGFVLNLWHRSQKKVSGWFLSRILACLFVGILSYIAFLIFNTKYPLSLGILAGVLNFVPFIGPIITGILIILLISLDSLSKAIFALLAFVLIQQIENNIITPILTKKFVDLSPVLVLISLAVGGKLVGFWGAILAIPLAGILIEFLKDYLKKRREEEPVAIS